MGDFSILEKRFISTRIDLAMLNFSFEFLTVFLAFDKLTFLILVCMD